MINHSLSIYIGDISEEAKHAYNLLINGHTNDSSSSHKGHLHSTSNDDLSSHNSDQTNTLENTSQHSPTNHSHATKAVFSSSSSSSASISTGSTSNNTQSNTSSSSSSSSSSSWNHQKSDRYSHYSSTSNYDISLDLKSRNDLSPLKYTFSVFVSLKAQNVFV